MPKNAKIKIFFETFFFVLSRRLYHQCWGAWVILMFFLDLVQLSGPDIGSTDDENISRIVGNRFPRFIRARCTIGLYWRWLLHSWRWLLYSWRQLPHKLSFFECILLPFKGGGLFWLPCEFYYLFVITGWRFLLPRKRIWWFYLRCDKWDGFAWYLVDSFWPFHCKFVVV